MDKRLLWFVLAGFISGTDNFVVGSLLPSISSELGITIGEAGNLAFAYSVVYAIGTPILATLLGNVERWKLLVAAELTFAVGAAMMALAPTFPLLVAARVVVGTGVGLFSAMALTTAVAMSPPERRARTIAVVTSGQSIAALAGVPLGALVVSTYSWRVVFAAVALMAAIAVVGPLLSLPRGIRGERVTLRERLSVVRLPGIPLALLSTFLFMMAQFTLVVFIAPLARYAGGIAAEVMPLVLLANGAGAVAGTQFGGRIADRFGARRATIIAAAIQAALFLSLAASGSLSPQVGIVAFFVISAAISAVGWGFYMAQASLIASLVAGPPVLALALNLTAMNVGVAIAARLGGGVLDRAGPFWLATAAGIVAILALLITGFVARTPRSNATT